MSTAPTPPAPPPPTPSFWARAWPYLYQVLYALLLASGGAGVHYCCLPGVAPAPAPAPGPQPAPAPIPPPPAPPPFGWIDDPDEVKKVVDGIDIKAFHATPAFAAGDDPDHVYLWDAAKKATGRHVPTRNQGQVGSCVSFGAACAVEYLECVQLAHGATGTFADSCQEAIYGGSRVQIGGGRIRGDGSTGGWAAQWVNKYGHVPRGVYGSIDITVYSETRCRQYGSQGCPRPLEPVAKKFPVKSVTTVATADECRKALGSGYPVTVASNQGFSMQRDAQGFCRATGTWPHQMCIIGYKKGTRPGFYVMNSWGTDWAAGPYGEGDPPPGGFWAEEKVVGRMLAQGDSWAYADLAGFPARRLNWTAVPRRRDRFVTLAPREVLSW